MYINGLLGFVLKREKGGCWGWCDQMCNWSGFSFYKDMELVSVINEMDKSELTFNSWT